MSRSNPTATLSNPSTRWFEWNGEKGEIYYYDKEAKKQVSVGSDFTFMVLDVLSVIKGWHDPSQSGIISNEIRDSRNEPFVVRSFKGGELASGLYADIKDRVNSVGGNFTANIYIAFRDGKDLKLGSIQFKGAALGSWMEFQKNNRKAIFEKAIRIKGSTEGQKGRIIYKMPSFFITEVGEESAAQAEAIDRDELQPYLKAYLGRGPQRQERDDEEETQTVYDVDDAFTRGQSKLTNERKEFEAEEARMKQGYVAPPVENLDELPECPF